MFSMGGRFAQSLIMAQDVITNAYLNGVLIYRFIILTIRFTIHPPIK
jgi:hypothetical protein